jgi:hypothetical protein
MDDRRRSYLLPLLLGIAVTLVLRGYQYGGGNHSVYLIAPLRQVHPELLKNDWWATQTLQYHVVFTNLTAGLMRLGIERPAFLVMYLGLVVLMHLAWLRLVVGLGFDSRVYLFSVLLYYLSAGGTGLGSYQFLQDSSFLPGNVANVAMLWGFVTWIEGRVWPAAIWLAVAGLFHLNHGLVGVGFWGVAILISSLSRTCRSIVICGPAPSLVGEGGGEGKLPGAIAVGSLPSPQPSPAGDYPISRQHKASRQREGEKGRVGLWGGFVAIALLAMPNVVPAARVSLGAGRRLPLAEFVELYVKLRHPHHYDPVSWPAALWVSFVWAIPLAWVSWRRMVTGRVPQAEPLNELRGRAVRAGLVFVFICALMGVALVFAGIVFVSEPLVQMSLFRFSIYPKLLSCVGAAAFLLNERLLERRGVRRAMLALPLVALAGLLVVRIARGGAASAFVGDNLAPLLIFVGLLAAGVVYVCRRSAAHAWVSRGFVVLVMAVLLAAWGKWLGLRVATEDRADGDYLAMCEWVRANTPVDAVFLVPPNEQSMRFHGQRAVVVNFKGVPQLSSELGQWRLRLEAVLDEPLSQLPRRFDRTHASIARRYDELPPAHLMAIARRYGARYVVTSRAVEALGQAAFENGSCHLYDLAR